MVTRDVLARERASVERLANAIVDASGGAATAVVEVQTGDRRTTFDLVIQRQPAFGPPLALKRLTGLSRPNLDLLSTVVEAIGEVR